MSDQDQRGIRRVVPDIRSDRLEESRESYVEIFGLTVAMDLGWVVTLVSPSNPTAQIILMGEDASAKRHPNLTIEVGDVDAVHAEVVRRGLEIVHP